MLKDYIKEIKIGSFKLNTNVFLAPMAGITDIPFRKIVRMIEPNVGLTFTEMASSKAMSFSSEKTEKLIEVMDIERPSIVQIFGSDVQNIVSMIKKLNDIDSIDIIDINMGCPAPKLVKNGDGAGLLLDLVKVKEILTKAVEVSKKPITVKTRKGFDDNIITAVEVAKIAEEAGVSMITVHGRTRAQYYSGQADLDIIKAVKNAVNIPVIGNGDIVDIQSAERMFEYTKCDGIMIARGALGNPWLFKEVISGVKYEISNEERLDTILKHIDYAIKLDTPKIANFKMRKHISWYLKGLHGSSRLKEKINTLEDIYEVKDVLIENF